MFGRLTPVVKNLLILNVIISIANYIFGNQINDLFGLPVVSSDYFMPYQLFTYMWLHSGLMHILFNMIGLIVFGPVLENLWGPKRFLIFYFVVGIGAGVFFGVADYLEKNPAIEAAEIYADNQDPEAYYTYIVKYMPEYLKADYLDLAYGTYENYRQNPDNELWKAKALENVLGIKESIMRSKMVGASGAIYGLLMAFGMLFPNMQLMLLFPPIPIKAKYLVMILAGFAIYSEFGRNGGNVAHLAHLGGMVIAFIMMKVWNQQRNNYY
ncbi:MAG: rhomboid family intramembrane serine protease [bacterium]|nr:rhomboid family intramembrane serine protease [bacterium]